MIEESNRQDQMSSGDISDSMLDEYHTDSFIPCQRVDKHTLEKVNSNDLPSGSFDRNDQVLLKFLEENWSKFQDYRICQ